MNNRGKQLTILEKLKNRLMYLTENLKTSPREDKDTLRGKINDAWGKIFVCLAKDQNAVLDEDEFLSAHLSLYKEPEQTTFSENLAEEKLFRMFCSKPEKYKEEPLSYQAIEKYILSLSEMAPVWYEIHHSSSIVQKILLLNASKEVKILLAAIFLKVRDKIKLQAVLALIEKFLFRNAVPGMYVINSDYDSARQARDIYNGVDINKFIGHLNDEISMQINTKSVIAGFRELFSYERGPKGFHRWGALKYFLMFEYEWELEKEYKETDDKVSLDSFYSTTIEHIIPKQYSEFWSKEVDDYSKKMNEKEKPQAIKVLINTLGNLTILKNGKNSELGNKSWAIKRERFTTGSYNEIEISKYENWNYKTIKDRGEKILRCLAGKVQDGFEFNEDEMMQILFAEDDIVKEVYK